MKFFLLLILFSISAVGAEVTARVYTADGNFLEVSKSDGVASAENLLIEETRYLRVNVQDTYVVVTSGPVSGGVVGHTVYQHAYTISESITFFEVTPDTFYNYDANGYYPVRIEVFVNEVPPVVGLNNDGTVDRDGNPVTSGDDELNDDGTVDGDGNPETGEEEEGKIALGEFPLLKEFIDRYDLKGVQIPAAKDVTFDINIRYINYHFPGFSSVPMAKNVIDTMRVVMQFMISLAFIFGVSRTWARY